MALIKCPECGKEVSTLADKCPHCGYPMSKENVEKKNYPKPKDESWIGKYRTKKILSIMYIIGLTIVVLLLFLLFLSLAQNDQRAAYTSYSGSVIYEPKVQWIVLSVLMGFILFIFVIVAIVSPFSIKLKAFKIEGYNIVLYTGVFNDALIIEDVLIESELDSMFHATYLDGELPNGTKVYARFCWGSMRLETKSFYSK